MISITPMTQRRTRVKQRPNSRLLDWRVGEDEAAWDQEEINQESGPLVKRAQESWLRKWAVLSAPLLLLLLAGYWQWRSAQSEMARKVSELEAAVMSSAPASVGINLLKVTNETALVELFVQEQVDGAIYRRLQVYTEHPTGWQRTVPSASLWGKHLHMETQYFTVAYRERDREAVEAAAQQFDALYLRFYSTFFAGVPASNKRTIEVGPEFETTAKRPDHYQITSPATTWMPVSFSDSDIVLHSFAIIALDALAKEATTKYSKPPYSDAFVAAAYLQYVTATMQLWQLAEAEFPVEIWQVARDTDYGWLSDYTQVLCALRQKQLAATLLHSGMPPIQAASESCPDAQRYEFASKLRWEQVTALTPMDATQGLEDPVADLARKPDAAGIVMLATVLDYAAATYGQASLPLLLANFASHRSWETLIPATFGTSTTEFEEGWQRYLQAKYKSNLNSPK